MFSAPKRNIVDATSLRRNASLMAEHSQTCVPQFFTEVFPDIVGSFGYPLLSAKLIESYKQSRLSYYWKRLLIYNQFSCFKHLVLIFGHLG